MTLLQHVIHTCAFWRRLHPSRALERIPAYRRAAEAERKATARGCTRSIGRARKAKREALHEAIADGLTKAAGKVTVV